MKVYLVYYMRVRDDTLEGVFASQEAASKFIDKQIKLGIARNVVSPEIESWWRLQYFVHEHDVQGGEG